MTSTKNGKRAGGRPPKFREGSRPITVTLPERILEALERVNPDRARALVKCVEMATSAEGVERTPVELIEVLPGKALIVVNSNRILNKIDWLRLVEISPARYLLVLPSGMPIERLEVEIQDLAETLDPKEGGEHRLLTQLQKMLVQYRRQKTVSKGALLFVDVV